MSAPSNFGFAECNASITLGPECDASLTLGLAAMRSGVK
jgi:hypothetical protein